ncbi:GNAT family protein [Streptomyces sp. GP55]|uniref:GNAT family N-acetyltransferase n=1 Tax=Kitasatospora sp. GP30 TaxID=3035084 RepID=UPI0015D591D0
MAIVVTGHRGTGGAPRMAGSLGLRIDRAEATAELGYWVDAEYEGRGLVRRAAELLIEHGFGPLGLRRIGLRTVVDNVRSRAPAERLGFTQESVLPQGAVLADGPRDLAVYGLSRDAWATRGA